MIDGMKIILERMKTNPEEFVNNLGRIGRWESIITMNNDVLTDEEMKAFTDALRELRRESFTAKVLQTLMEEPVTVDPNTYTINTAGRYTGGASVSLNASQKAYSPFNYEEELQRLVAETYAKQRK